MSIPVAIYPFCAEILPVVKTFEKLQNLFVINCLISPSGFGLSGHDAGYVCNHPNIGIVVTDEFNYDDTEWTTLILFEPIMIKEKVDYSYGVIAEQAVLHGKHVIFLSSSAKVNDNIKELSDLYFDKIEIREYIKSNGNYRKVGQIFHDVEVPIVLLGGLLEEADNYEILLKLASKLKLENVNTLVFTKHPIGELLGFHNMDHIWNCSDYSEAQKIKEINHYINSIVEIERPEVILLEAPDAVLRYNDYAVNGFGIRTYMLCQAVTPDRFVCCVPFELASDNFLSVISLGFEKTLGASITSVHASNILIDTQELMQKRDISIVHSDLKFVREQLFKEREHSKIPIYNVVVDEIDELYNDLFENQK